MTQVKQDMPDNCRSPVERFVAVMEDEIMPEGILYDWVGKNNEKAISCANFYELFKLWCQTNGEKSWSNRAVGSELKSKKLYLHLDKSMRQKVQRKYYVF